MVKDCFKKKRGIANTEKEAAHPATEDEDMVFLAMDDGVKEHLMQEDMALFTMNIPARMGTCPACADTGYLLNRCGKCNVTFETHVIGMSTKCGQCGPSQKMFDCCGWYDSPSLKTNLSEVAQRTFFK
jgi:hypothetical protein